MAIVISTSKGEKVFSVFNTLFLFILCIIFILPVWHVAMGSISDPLLVAAHSGLFLKPLGEITLGGYELVMENRNGMYRIDSRPSDAIYIQQKLNVPIYTTREVLDEAGIITDKEKKKAVSNLKPKNRLSSIDIYDLQKMLNIAIKNEDYEQAAQIHAEIKHRSEQK